jgi:hypothetical protein
MFDQWYIAISGLRVLLIADGPHVAGTDCRYRNQVIIHIPRVGGRHSSPLATIPVHCQRRVDLERSRRELITHGPYIVRGNGRHPVQ